MKKKGSPQDQLLVGANPTPHRLGRVTRAQHLVNIVECDPWMIFNAFFEEHWISVAKIPTPPERFRRSRAFSTIFEGLNQPFCIV
jgi:hypothetical protein